jgi:uncharacterized membrane protein
MPASLHEWLAALTELVVPLIELAALLFIAFGTAEAFFHGVRGIFRGPNEHAIFRLVWTRYSRWLVAGLTFQLAADIIETSTAPDWTEIGKLAAIAVIRTFLNYFLERDQHEMRELEEEARSGNNAGKGASRA